jgi:hypothetical protein
MRYHDGVVGLAAYYHSGDNRGTSSQRCARAIFGKRPRMLPLGASRETFFHSLQRAALSVWQRAIWTLHHTNG